MKTNKRKRKAKPRKTRQLKPFGEGSMASRFGYDIGIIIGWFEDVVNHEDDEFNENPAHAERLRIAYEALDYLNQLMEMEPQE